MNRHRRGPSTHVLIAGDERDLEVVAQLVAALPADAFGQVLIETPIESGPPALSTPDRVTVQWLPRTADAAPGGRLAESLTCWAREWLVEGDRHLNRCHHLFIGAAGVRAVEVVREVLFVDECHHLESLGDIVVTRSGAIG
ncbi:SIP domain-containing protein [Flexivirga oryzae]|uniref:NADPH-dependent ferric siderophore reductase n=1 Tax=Flexivirga oryzae TaxID=1794944 RepID=A0A839NFE1_9MICO|nr:SIP domain-containing protein [Flexivirga oryzae]MBB2893855.1 NADPH-dependent ferric siderophore reductase [Flexivirga oryzae]